MLNDYREYEEFYHTIIKSIENDSLSHAYMFEIDDSIDIQKLEIDLSKAIITKNNSINKDEITLIEKGNCPNIKIVRTDSGFIKTNQIEDLKEDFSKESFESYCKIYFIEEAEKLNSSSANKLLKFLEEPSNDVYGILLTKNKYSVIETIKSRCITISLKRNVFLELDEESHSVKIINLIEKYKKRSLYYIYEYIKEHDLSRDDIYNIFEEIQMIYFDLIYINRNISNKFRYFKEIPNLNYDKNEILLSKKIDAINKYKEYLKLNISPKTFIDEIVFYMYGE